MQHIQKAIKRFLKNAGLENGIAQQKAVEVWADVVGEKVAITQRQNPLNTEH